MKALTYIEHGKFALQEKAKQQLVSARNIGKHLHQ